MTNEEELPRAEPVDSSVRVTGPVVQATIIDAVPHRLPEEPSDNVLIAYSLSKTVKIFAWIDIIFSFLNMMFYGWLYIFSAIGAMIGLYSAKKHDPRAAMCYLTFNVVHLIVEICVFLWVVIEHSDSVNGWYYSLSIINIICLMWITKIIAHYADSLRKLSDSEKETLFRLGHMRVRTILY